MLGQLLYLVFARGEANKSTADTLAGSSKATTRLLPNNPPPGPSPAARRGKLEVNKVWARLPTPPRWAMASAR